MTAIAATACSTTSADVVVAVVRGPEGRSHYTTLRSSPLLAVRPTIDGVHLVSPTATPVGGDVVRVHLHVGPGATLVVRSVAAAVARRGPDGSASHHIVEAHVARGGRLWWEVEPLVAAEGCHHRSEVSVQVATGGHLWWRDTLVAGRADEPPGWCRSRLRVDVGGRPALRHELTIGPGTPAPTPAVIGPARAIATVVAVGPPARALAAPRTHQAEGAVASVLPLAVRGASLVEAFAPDHLSLTAVLAQAGIQTHMGTRPVLIDQPHPGGR